mmetsp:Transcript_34405/g.64832  ORF Transcript_34405/g.64832 Transcript_34405/m.64832 type:complete len:312 (-) Transcript_34405:106-1041(-)
MSARALATVSSMGMKEPHSTGMVHLMGFGLTTLLQNWMTPMTRSSFSLYTGTQRQLVKGGRALLAVSSYRSSVSVCCTFTILLCCTAWPARLERGRWISESWPTESSATPSTKKKYTVSAAISGFAYSATASHRSAISIRCITGLITFWRSSFSSAFCCVRDMVKAFASTVATCTVKPGTSSSSSSLNWPTSSPALEPRLFRSWHTPTSSAFSSIRGAVSVLSTNPSSITSMSLTVWPVCSTSPTRPSPGLTYRYPWGPWSVGSLHSRSSLSSYRYTSHSMQSKMSAPKLEATSMISGAPLRVAASIAHVA